MSDGKGDAGPPNDPTQEIKRLLDAAEPIGNGDMPEVESAKAEPEPVKPKGTRKAKAKPAPANDSDKAKGSDKASKRRRPPQRDSLMSLTEGCDLWHDEDGESFATFDVGDHRESWSVRSDRFKRWLAARAYEKTGLVPGAQAVEDTLRVLEARAATEGRLREPWMRVGAQGGVHYLDLCDAGWNVVEIGPKGWNIIRGHGLPFIRTRAMRPLCEPEGGCGIDELRRFVNVASDEDFILVVAWMVAALRNTGPYPILVVNGEQGSGKSTFSRLIRSMVDPNAAPIRAVPKDDRDLIVSAGNAHVLAMDNLSRVEAWLADGLCRLATGSGFSTRKLMTDRDEAIFMASRPIILNGIPTLTDRADLADRAVTVRLKSIPEDERRPEDEFWADWNATAPRVLGALCDAVSSAVARVGSVRLERSPRLADFAKWMTAAEPGLGWEPGTFMGVYSDNRREVSDTAFEADPVAVAILAYVWPRPFGFEGTATELLAGLNDVAAEPVRRLRSWPLTAQSLGNRLERCAPLLRTKGLHFQKHHSGTRTISIVRLAAAAEAET